MFGKKTTLQARRLVRTFDQGGTVSTVLREVSLELYRGELALLMGPSGSGKSTLLAVLSGLLSPTQGQVLALDQDYWALGEVEQERFRQRHFGYIFQGCNLLPALDGQAAIGNGAALGRGDAAARGSPAGRGHAGNAGAGPERRFEASGIIRRRKAARGHRPCAGDEASLLFRG